MVQEIRKEVIGLLDRWIQEIRRFSVRLVSLLVSIWIATGVLGIAIMAPLYVGKFFLKGTGVKTNQDQVIVRERIRPSVPRYEPTYRIQGNQMRPNWTLRDGIRETRNTLSELRSASRAAIVLGKGSI